MSPRSEEFMQAARERLADAQKIVDIAHPAVVISVAYYAMPARRSEQAVEI